MIFFLLEGRDLELWPPQADYLASMSHQRSAFYGWNSDRGDRWTPPLQLWSKTAQMSQLLNRLLGNENCSQEVASEKCFCPTTIYIPRCSPLPLNIDSLNNIVGQR